MTTHETMALVMFISGIAFIIGWNCGYTAGQQATK